MYSKIAIITARSGSKGLPNKNILMLGEKELIAYSIEAALKSKVFDKVIVSTDSEEYKDISEKYGAEVILREAKLATDTATSFEVIEDVLKKQKKSYDYFVLLQPTSPFRNENHVKEAVEKFEKNIEKYDFLVSMVESDKSRDLIVTIEEDESLKNYDIDFSNYRRQNYKEYYPNGAIFIGKSDKYLKQKHFFGEKSLAYIMDKEDSIDIDTPLDFEIAIAMMNKKKKREALTKLIKERIDEKVEFYRNKSENEEDIYFLGHSILDNLGENIVLENKNVINWGIRGINSQEYNDWILDKNLIKKIGNKAIIMFGTNDIVVPNWTKEKILENILKIIEKVKKINKKVKIYFIEITRVRNRMDRNDNDILEINKYLFENLKNKVEYILINKKIEDKYGKLRNDLTYDGLHFNDKGNKILLETIMEAIR